MRKRPLAVTAATAAAVLLVLFSSAAHAAKPAGTGSVTIWPGSDGPCSFTVTTTWANWTGNKDSLKVDLIDSGVVGTTGHFTLTSQSFTVNGSGGTLTAAFSPSNSPLTASTDGDHMLNAEATLTTPDRRPQIFHSAVSLPLGPGEIVDAACSIP